MITIQEARACVLERARGVVSTERVPVRDAVGRTLAADVLSDGDLPPFDRVMMDGYAVRASDLRDGGVTLPVDGEVAAGDAAEEALPPGCARAIMTGAPLPPGADAVVQVEWTEEGVGGVTIARPVKPGQNVAPRGQDLVRGTPVARSGDRATPLSLSLLIASGVGEVLARRRPSVALLTSGDELVPPGMPIRRGQIRESNGPALASLLATTGARVVDLGIVRDDRAELAARVEEALDHDVVVLTGGSSMGRYDFSAEVVEALGATCHFDRVSVKPGKPTLFHTRGERLVFCLPGNPVAALMTGRVLVAPALVALDGRGVEDWPGPTGRLAAAVRRNASRDLLIPVRWHADGEHVVFDGWHGSGDLVSMARAQAFAHVECGEGEAPAGTPCAVFSLPAPTAW